MPSINRIRLSNIPYNDGLNYYDDHIIDLKGLSGTATLINGAGKTFLLQSMMQTVLPKSHFDKRKPYKKIFNKVSYGIAAHVQVEWLLDENSDYKYMLAGFCATKRHKKSDLYGEENTDKNADSDYEADDMECFNYLCFYNKPNEFDLKNFPLKTVEEGQVKRMGFNDLRNYLGKLKKEVAAKVDYDVQHNFSSNAEYQRMLANYNIYTTEWELMKELNRDENYVAKYYAENFPTVSKLIQGFLIPIIEKCNITKSNGDYQDENKMAETLLELKDNLKNLISKRDLMKEYEKIESIVKGVANIDNDILEAYHNRDVIIHSITTSYNYLTSLIRENVEYLDALEDEKDELYEEKRELEKLRDGYEILEKINDSVDALYELDECQYKYNVKLEEQRKVNYKYDLYEAENKYLDYKNEQTKYNKATETLRLMEQDNEEVLKERNYYGKVYESLLTTKIIQLDDLKEAKTQTSSKISEGLKEYRKRRNEISDRSAADNVQLKNAKVIISENTQKKNEALQIIPSEYILDYNYSIKEVERDISKNDVMIKEIETDLPRIESEMNELRVTSVRLDEKHKQLNKELEGLNKEYETYKSALEEIDAIKLHHKNPLDIIDYLRVAFNNITDDIHKNKTEKDKQAIRQRELEENKGIATHEDLRSIYEFIKNKYSSALLGLDFIKEKTADKKDKLLSNCSIIPYSIIVSSRDFEKVQGDTTLSSRFGDLAFPIINSDVLRSEEKVNIEGISFTVKDKSLFINEDLIKREIEATRNRVKSLDDLIAMLQESLEILKAHQYKVLRFFEVYGDNTEVRLTESIDAVNKNISTVKKAMDDSNSKQGSLLAEKQKKTDKRNELQDEKAKLQEWFVSLNIFSKAVAIIDEQSTLANTLEKSIKALEIELSNVDAEIGSLEDDSNRLYKEAINIANECDKLRNIKDIVSDNIIGVPDLDQAEVTSISVEEATAKYESAREAVSDKIKSYEAVEKERDGSKASMDRIKDNLFEPFALEFLLKSESEGKNIMFHSRNEMDDLRNEKKKLEDERATVNQELTEKRDAYNKVNNTIDILKVQLVKNYDEEYDDLELDTDKDVTHSIYSIKVQLKKATDRILENANEAKEYEIELDSLKEVKVEVDKILHTEDICIETEEKADSYDYLKEAGSLLSLSNKAIIKLRNDYKKHMDTSLSSINGTKLFSFIEELSSLEAPSNYEACKRQIDLITGEDGYLNDIDNEKVRVNEDINSLQKCEEVFINLCIQKSDHIYNDLKKLEELSKIEFDGEKKEMIKLVIKVLDDDIKKARMKNYIHGILNSLTDDMPEQKKKKLLSDDLEVGKLFAQIVEDINRCDVKIFKYENIRGNSRHLAWKEAVGSSGQSNSMYITFSMCIISYIRNLYSSDTGSHSKKFVWFDNPFGPTGASYLWESIPKIAKENNIQLFCVGYRIPPNLLNLFGVNYRLTMKMIGNKSNIVIEDIKGEMPYEEDKEVDLLIGQQISMDEIIFR